MRYLTVKEAAEAMRVSQQTIRRWAKTGEIKCIQRGSTIRIPESEVRVKDDGAGNSKPVLLDAA